MHLPALRPLLVHTVLLYVLFCLTYMYSTQYPVRTIHCTFPVSSCRYIRTSVHVQSHSLVIHLHSLSLIHILLQLSISHTRLVLVDTPSFGLATISIFVFQYYHIRSVLVKLI